MTATPPRYPAAQKVMPTSTTHTGLPACDTWTPWGMTNVLAPHDCNTPPRYAGKRIVPPKHYVAEEMTDHMADGMTTSILERHGR